MYQTLLYTTAGYLAGSILFSQVWAVLFHQSDITVNSMDHNPGVWNAFKNGGLQAGLFTLTGDFLKGFLPVWLYLHLVPFANDDIGLAFVMTAPVLGTICPVFYRFRGGKGITVSFGILTALLPEWQPLALLAICFVLFSTVLVIDSHYHRTLCTYILFAIGTLLLSGNMNALAGCLMMAMLITGNLLLHPDTLHEFKVKPVWKQ